ncbi:hypothetical protein D3C71_1739900 [compost metagenome]
MYVDERFAGEGGEAFKTVDQAHGRWLVRRARIVFCPCHHAERIRALAQRLGKAFFNVRAQGLAAARHILRITIQQFDQRGCVVGIGVVHTANGHVGTGGVERHTRPGLGG